MPFLQSLKKPEVSPEVESTVRDLITAEEINGAETANRFRYVLGILLAIQSYVVTDNMSNAIVNGSAVLGYATITVLHTLALRKRRLNITRLFNYLTLVLDYALIVLVLIYYNYVSDPDNLNFSIKSPVLLILLLPLTLTAIQFRAPLVIFAFALFAVIYYTIVTLAITGTSPTTNKWNDYINGPAPHFIFWCDFIVDLYNTSNRIYVA